MPHSVRLLHVEDSPLDRDLVRDALEIEHGGFIVTSASSRAAFEKALAHGGFDIVLTDFNILGFEGLEVIDAVHGRYPDVPVIVLTGTGSEEAAVRSLQQGAADYVIKSPSHIQRLPQTIHGVLEHENLRHERAMAAEALRRVAQKYQSIFENVSEGVFQTTPEGRFLSANPALARIFGYPSPEALMDDLNAIELYCDPSRRDALIAELQNKGSVENFEAEVRRRDGTTLWIRENVHQAWRENGDPIYEGTVEDVTERKLAQEGLEAANRELELRVAERTRELRVSNEQLQRELEERREIEARLRRAYAMAESATRAQHEFLSRISHELRTPLNAILGFGQLMELDEMTAEQEESLAQIMRAGNNLLKLVNEILDISQVESRNLDLKMESVSVTPLIEECLLQMRPVANDSGVQLWHCVGQPGAAGATTGGNIHVQADARRLKQAMLNLISNAIRFNHAQGTVTLSSELLRPDGKSPRCARIKIADTGRGIPAENLASIFVPFKRIHVDEIPAEGAGLGLAMAKSLIEAMEGKVGVDSTPGAGSTFWIDLPLADPMAETSALP